MSRNFGVTSPPAIGGNRPAGSHGGKLNAPHNLILFPSRSTLERPEIGEPSFDERELGATCLFIGLLFAAALIVFCVFIGYQALIA